MPPATPAHCAPMHAPFRTRVVESMQMLIISLARPYILRELPGWGYVYRWAVGDERQREWFWAEAPQRTVRGKLHGFEMQLDLSHWSDRSTFFLGRWIDLHNQLFMLDLLEPGDTVVDVGAHRGSFALVASKLVGRKGKVVCFDAHQTNAAHLDRDIRANGIDNIVVQREAPADDALAAEHPALIKIDGDDDDFRVIAELSQTIERDRPVLLTEVPSAQNTQRDQSMLQLMSVLAARGYSGFTLTLRRHGLHHRWGLAPLHGGRRALNAVWFHADFLSRHAASLQRYGLPALH
jgi:FtsJ-like methyltransferase